ncbi:MAG TPA: hypothetical protein VNO70_03080, partial [Blastocatellia bacterium]|nr:hypothetical protein [Blastocatellia bacterium]
MAAENKRIKTGLRPETEENAPATVPQNQAVARYPSALVFGAVAAGSLAWHFVAAESDTGGTFFQIWISVVALIGLTKADSTPSRFPILIWTVVLPMVCSLTIATLYFAVQAIIPLALLTALLGALWYFSQDRKKMAFLLLLLLPMVFYVRYGIRHMQTVYQIRHLDAAQVNRIEFSPLSRTEGKSRAIQLAAQDELKKIVAALAATVPYSPNH